MAEMQAFYDAITPRAEEAISYCDKFPLDDMPEDVLNLMHLLYSMIMVSFPVECWKQPRVPDSGAADAGLRRRTGAVTHRPARRALGRRRRRRGALACRGRGRRRPHRGGESR